MLNFKLFIQVFDMHSAIFKQLMIDFSLYIFKYPNNLFLNIKYL